MAYHNQGRDSAEGSPIAGIRGSKKTMAKSAATLIVVLIIIIGGIYAMSMYGPFSQRKNYDSNWQAVFLTNGQVYFGKIEKIDSDFLHLNDIYYLQVVTDQSALGQTPDVQEEPEQRLQLIKLGNEIHGPQDAMMISRDHVIIIEELNDENSRVVQAINDYVENN